MKKILMLTVFVLFALVSAEAQIVVKVRPVAPVVIRPACPSAHHVWVGGSWTWNRKARNYVWTDGYWARPRRHGVTWVDGHWRASRGGWKYIHGHWS
jgi:hypothetical protein